MLHGLEALAQFSEQRIVALAHGQADDYGVDQLVGADHHPTLELVGGDGRHRGVFELHIDRLGQQGLGCLRGSGEFTRVDRRLAVGLAVAFG
ncbi:hypothetical protein AB688_14480 [Pseudomonas putida]|nr:hypothetical protein AB688_14480 [Pseudomonas putida]